MVIQRLRLQQESLSCTIPIIARYRDMAISYIYSNISGIYFHAQSSEDHAVLLYTALHSPTIKRPLQYQNEWRIDILGPLPQAPIQRKFLIVAVDYFTKWIGTEPLPKSLRGMPGILYGRALCADLEFSRLSYRTTPDNSTMRDSKCSAQTSRSPTIPPRLVTLKQMVKQKSSTEQS